MRRPDEKKINACPGEEAISSLAEGKLSRRQREDLLKHIAVCETCAAELYLIRKFQPAKTTVRRAAKNRNIFQLAAIAAMLALIIGYAGMDALNKGKPGGGINAAREMEELHESIPPAASAPPQMGRNMAFEAPETAQDMALEAETQMAQSFSGARLIYEVVYNGHDGDRSEIIRLIRLITGEDEESAAAVAESGSAVLKKCSSMEEAQKIKDELESAGAKIEIIRRKF